MRNATFLVSPGPLPTSSGGVELEEIWSNLETPGVDGAVGGKKWFESDMTLSLEPERAKD